MLENQGERSRTPAGHNQRQAEPKRPWQSLWFPLKRHAGVDGSKMEPELGFSYAFDKKWLMLYLIPEKTVSLYIAAS